MNLLRGGVYLAELGLDRPKPVLIVSEDGINIGLREPVVARITTNLRDRAMQTCVELDAGTAGLDEVSYVLCHDLTTLMASDFLSHLGMLPFPKVFAVDRKLRLALRLDLDDA